MDQQVQVSYGAIVALIEGTKILEIKFIELFDVTQIPLRKEFLPNWPEIADDYELQNCRPEPPQCVVVEIIKDKSIEDLAAS